MDAAAFPPHPLRITRTKTSAKILRHFARKKSCLRRFLFFWILWGWGGIFFGDDAHRICRSIFAFYCRPEIFVAHLKVVRRRKPWNSGAMVDFERLGFRCFFGNLAAPKKLIKKNNSSPRGRGVGVGHFFSCVHRNYWSLHSPLSA